MEVSSSPEQDSSTPPPGTPLHHASTKKTGGWKSIAYIIGNVQKLLSFCMMFFCFPTSKWTIRFLIFDCIFREFLRERIL